MSANQRSARSTFIVDYAIRYARDYATSPNTAEYPYINGADCSNFASQIMVAGGMEMNDYWYHTSYQGGFHTYSNSWSVANNFARYWGVEYTTTSHYNFAKYLRAGDFIMGDWDGDGKWDHAGFVIQSDDYLTDGGEFGYYHDYLVAQHTDNYLAWTSYSNNGWELDNGKFIYGVIRK